MIPDPGEILRRRTTSATVVRILAFVPLFAGAAVGAAWGFAANEDRLYTGEHMGYAVAIGVFVFFACLMWALAPWHARRSVKMPKSVVCPACNYKIAGLAEARCPECGLPLTSEFIATPGERTPPPRDPDRATLRQISTAVLRLTGVLIGVFATPYLIYFLIETARFVLGSNSYYDWDDFGTGLILTAGLFVLACGLVVFGKMLSAFMVPSRASVGGPAEPPTASSPESAGSSVE